MDRYSDGEIDPVFRAVCQHWITLLRKARDHKQKVFALAAQECQDFYNGPKTWNELMGDVAGGTPDSGAIGLLPSFRVSVNKTFEFVTIFGPALYFENPVRTVKPRMPVVVPPQFFPDPGLYQSLILEENQRIMRDGLRGVLLEAYLNWTPMEFGLAGDAREAVNDALIQGRGCLWTELYTPPGSDMKVVRSFHDSTRNLQVDPDAKSFESAQWIARRCVHPVWQVEREYGLRPGSLKGHCESLKQQAEVDADEDAKYDRARGLTNDLIVYWKIYSRMGIGGRIAGLNPKYRNPLEMFGDYCYVVVAEGVPFPLNLSPDVMADPAFASNPRAVFDKVAWPTPFWAADGKWPVSVLDFHKVDQCPWPLPHLKAGMGELKFLNWAMSFILGKIRNTSRDFIAMKKSAGEELKTAILEGRDLALLEIEHEQPGLIQEIVSFLQHPQMNGDIWRVIEAVENLFDKRVGLTELMYGTQGATQIRSAEEASLRNQNTNVRPDDMRRQVEAWMSEVGAKEAVCARYHLVPRDVAPVLGTLGAAMWGQHVATRDIATACHQLEYRIETGSTQRPNKNWESEAMNQAFQTLAPLLQGYGQATGDLAPINNLLADYAKSRDLDPGRYQLNAPMPPPAPPVIPGHKDDGQQTQATSGIPAPG